mgnify:CR=1 FL=1
MASQEGPQAVAFGEDGPVSDFLRSLLKPGERVVWTGRPSSGAFARHDWPMASWGALMAALGVFFTLQLLASENPKDYLGVPVTALFACAASVQAMLPLINAVRARGTFYAITTTRVLILRRWLGWSVVSIRPANFARVTRYDMDDDRGSVGLRFSQRGHLFGKVLEPAKLWDGLWGIGDFRAAMLAIHHLMTDVRG